MKRKLFTLLGFFVSLFFYSPISAGAEKAQPSPTPNEGAQKNLPLVFDPSTKKYFIGGNSKLILRQGDLSGPVERIEVSVDGGEYKPYSDTIQFSSEGKHTLKFRAINPVNNWSPVQFVEVFSDLTPPTTEAKFSEERYHQTEGGLYLGVNSTINLTAQDNLAGIGQIEWAWGTKGGDSTNASFAPYLKPITVENVGKHVLLFRASDRVGNTEQTRKLEFIADGTAPTSTLEIKNGEQGQGKSVSIKGQTYLSDSVSLSIQAVDDASKVKQIWVTVDGKSQIYINPIHFLKEGAHSLSYYAVDYVGNKEPAKTFNFQVVSTPPKTLVKTTGQVVNTGGINYARRDFVLKLEAQENLVGLDHIEVRLDQEQEFRAYLEPVRFSAPGLHTVYYRAVDRAGNIEPTRTFVLNIHETAPETSYTVAQPLLTRDGVTYSASPNVVTFNVTGSPVGLKNTLISVNDGPWTSYQHPLTITSDRKVNKIMYKSVDKLENEEQPKTLTTHMIGTVPLVDLFITNGKSKEEQIRTDFLEKPAGAPEKRNPASN